MTRAPLLFFARREERTVPIGSLHMGWVVPLSSADRGGSFFTSRSVLAHAVSTLST